MNKKFTITFVLIVALTLSVAALMIGCNADIPKTEGASENTGTSGTQSTDTSGTTDISADTTENADDEQNEDLLPPDVDAFMGVIDSTGGEVVDDEPQNPITSQPTQPQQPGEHTKPTQQTNRTPEEILGEDFDIGELDWAEYHAMDAEKQMAVINLFSTPDDFAKWHSAALALYKAEHPEIEIGPDGTPIMPNQ